MDFQTVCCVKNMAKTRGSTNVMMFTINGTDGMGTLACFEDLGNKLVETLRIDFVPYTKRKNTRRRSRRRSRRLGGGKKESLEFSSRA